MRIDGADRVQAGRAERARTLSATVSRARDVSLVLLVASGILLAFATRDAAILTFHRVLAEACLALCLADIAVALVLGSYATNVRAWFSRVGVLALVAPAYVLGFAMGAGEAGAEGRAHLGRAVGLAAPLPVATAFIAHLGLALAALAVVVVLVRSFPRSAWTRAPLGLAALVVVLASIAVAPGVIVERDVPAVEGVEVARAPWIARAVSPLEASSPALAGAALVAGLASLALLPVAARHTFAGRRVVGGALAAGALAIVSLTIAVTLAPLGH